MPDRDREDDELDVALLRSEHISTEVLGQIHDLLFTAFDASFSDDDWSHALGGWHVVVLQSDGRAVAHAAVVPRVLYVGDRQDAAGYVEAVATRPGLQGHGLGTTVMRKVGCVLHEHFQMGALSTGAPGFYTRLGWIRWRGATFVQAATGRLRTAEEDDGVMALMYGLTARLSTSSDLTCEERAGDDW